MSRPTFQTYLFQPQLQYRIYRAIFHQSLNDMVSQSTNDIAQSKYSELVRIIESGNYVRALSILKSISWEIISKDHALLNAYGIVLRAHGRYDESIRLYHRSLNLNSSQAGTWSNLGNALKDANFIESSIEAHIKAIKMSPSPSPKLWHNYGISLSIAGRHEDAIAAYENALSLPNSNLSIRWDLARSLLAIKRYAEGFKNYQYRWFMEGAPNRRVLGQEWSGQKLSDEELFIYAEQGFGDYIQCARYIPNLQKIVKNLVVEVKPELKMLMQHSFPLVKFVDFTEQTIERQSGYIFSLLDLPKFFLEDVPTSSNGYLKPSNKNDNFSENLQHKLHDVNRINVGIVWSGSVTFKRNAYRSADVSWFLNSLNLPNVNLFSLQFGPRSMDLRTEDRSIISEELLPHINNFDDTARILRQLDLVIMTCSSVAHLCGALNKRCWLLLDASPHWLWGVDVDSSDWYSSIKLFRQKSAGNWRSVFDKVAATLMIEKKSFND